MPTTCDASVLEVLNISGCGCVLLTSKTWCKHNRMPKHLLTLICNPYIHSYNTISCQTFVMQVSCSYEALLRCVGCTLICNPYIHSCNNLSCQTFVMQVSCNYEALLRCVGCILICNAYTHSYNSLSCQTCVMQMSCNYETWFRCVGCALISNPSPTTTYHGKHLSCKWFATMGHYWYVWGVHWFATPICIKKPIMPNICHASELQEVWCGCMHTHTR